MTVTIEFMGMQRVRTGRDSIQMALNGRTTARQALDYLKTTYPELILNEDTILVTVNHAVVPLDRVLESGDRLCFVPPIGGG